MTDVVITKTGDVVVETRDTVSVVTSLDTVSVITTPAEQGPPGPQGPVGPAGSVYMTYTAGITLSGHKAVQIDGLRGQRHRGGCGPSARHHHQRRAARRRRGRAGDR